MSEPRNVALGNVFLSAIYNCARWLVIIAATVMVGAAILQAASRHIIGLPIGWSDELARTTLVWTVFISVAVLAAQRRLLRVDALLLALPERVRTLTSALINLICAAFLGWMFFLSVMLVQLAGGQVTAALGIPYSLVYLSFPVGLSGATLFSVVNLISDVRAFVDGSGNNTGRPASLAKDDIL